MSTPDTLAQRYGTPDPWRRRALLVVVGLVVALFAGWLAWTVWEQSRPLVASEQLAFEIIDDNTATALVQIEFREDDVDAVCTLKAYAEDHTLVGELDFYPDPAAGERYTQEINTDRRATSVESEGCTAPGQSRRR